MPVGPLSRPVGGDACASIWARIPTMLPGCAGPQRMPSTVCHEGFLSWGAGSPPAPGVTWQESMPPDKYPAQNMALVSMSLPRAPRHVSWLSRGTRASITTLAAGPSDGQGTHYGVPHARAPRSLLHPPALARCIGTGHWRGH